MRPIKFKVPVYAIQELPWEEEKRVCIWVFPIRWFWDDIVVIEMDEILSFVDKYFPDCDYHWEGTFKDSEWCCNIHLEWCEASNEWDDFEFFVNQIELLQFTWLLDKNRKEIYEEDIVKLKWENFEDIVTVINENCSFHFRSTTNNRRIDKPLYCFAINYLWHFKCIEVEVIGNIHENPELLSTNQ